MRCDELQSSHRRRQLTFSARRPAPFAGQRNWPAIVRPDTMCQRIYTASSDPLPSLERSHSAPHLAILPLASGAAAVRRWFSKTAKHFAEAHGSAPCGCGFPESSDSGQERSVAPGDAETVKALAAYLEQRLRAKSMVEILLCWVGDEGEKPPHTREVDLGTLRTLGFRFRRGEVLRLRRTTKPGL